MEREEDGLDPLLQQMEFVAKAKIYLFIYVCCERSRDEKWKLFANEKLFGFLYRQNLKENQTKMYIMIKQVN